MPVHRPASDLSPVIQLNRPVPATKVSDRPMVDLILYRGCEAACQGFRDWFASRDGGVMIRQHDADVDPDAIRLIVEQIRADPGDVVVTWGTTTAKTVFGTIGEVRSSGVQENAPLDGVPGVFMIVSQPVEAGVVEALAAPGRRVTGTIYLAAVSEQIEAALVYIGDRRSAPRDETPGVTHIGMVWNPAEVNAYINMTQLTLEAKERGIDVTALPLQIERGGAPDPAEIPVLVDQLVEAGADLIYQPADTFLNIHRKVLTEAALDHQVPVLAAGEAPVRSGKALLGIVYDYYDVGRRTAQIVQRVLNGDNPATIPVGPPSDPKLLVNGDVAAALNLFPGPDLMPFAEFVRPED